MKTHRPSSRAVIATGIAAVLLSFCSGSLRAQAPAPAKPTPAAPAIDPAAHATHTAAGTHPAATPAPAGKGNSTLSQDVSHLQAKIAQLEATLAKSARPVAAAQAGASMPGMPAAAPATGMDKTKPGGMATMSGAAAPTPAMAGMSGGAPTVAMMGMMDKMIGMMDKMMGMSGGALPAAAPMPVGGGGMGMMDMGMDGGAMPAGAPAPAAVMSGGVGMGMMAMDKMEMAGMMGMGGMGAAAPGAMPQSAMPGFPGASHLYHIGATGFFLDHPQHIALTTEQQAALNKAKEQALLAKSTADRAKEQAEQELWTLTAADQPDAVKIEAKLAEIGKLAADERLAFIRAVGEASKLLTDEQRKILTGFAPPAPAAAMPAAGTAMPASGMQDM